MPRGGPRPGAGRKKGGRTKKTRAVAVRAAAEGITPLEVLLDAMRRLHKDKEYAKAAAVAKDAAPYVHPRLSSVALSGGVAVRKVIVEELIDGDVIADGTAAPGAA